MIMMHGGQGADLICICNLLFREIGIKNLVKDFASIVRKLEGFRVYRKSAQNSTTCTLELPSGTLQIP
jgi:hypothetical protein